MRPLPLSFDSADGARMTDADGNRYLDYMLAWGPLFLGHGHPAVVAAVGEQLHRAQAFGAGHRLEYETAELLLEITPGAERVLWSNTGSEAVQVALRLARAATGRQRFVKFAGHYHGWQDNVLINYRGADALDDSRPVPTSAGQSAAAMSDARIARWNDLGSLERLLADPANDVGAVILEPVLANSGLIEPAPGFLQSVRELCDRYGQVLIFDEVITGARLALGGAREFYGVIPDLSTMAKGIASGFSLAAVVGRRDILGLALGGVVHAGTYNGSPIALAAAHATLATLRETRPHAHASALAATLATGLASAFARAGLPATAHAVGPIAQLVLGPERPVGVEDYLASDFAAYDDVLEAMAARGSLGLPGGRWYVSAAHTADDIAETVAAAESAAAALAGARS
ncbi:glutamate-1-semialdehyde 2,1-aminomutase [Agromyces soli]